MDFRRDFEEISWIIEEGRMRIESSLGVLIRPIIGVSFRRKEGVAKYRETQMNDFDAPARSSNQLRRRADENLCYDKFQNEFEIQRLREDLSLIAESKKQEKRAREKAEDRLRQSEAEKSRVGSTDAHREKEKNPEGKIDQAYRILDLKSGATQQEVKSAYRYMAQAHHPDRFDGMPQHQKTAEEKIKEINAAYQVLKSHLRF
jgi:DnaJ-domain-containing protein 1